MPLTEKQIHDLWITQQQLANPTFGLLGDAEKEKFIQDLDGEFESMKEVLINRYGGEIIDGGVGDSVSDDSLREPFFVQPSRRISGGAITAKVVPYWGLGVGGSATLFDEKLWLIMNWVYPEGVITNCLEMSGPLNLGDTVQLNEAQDIFYDTLRGVISLDVLNQYFFRAACLVSYLGDVAVLTYKGVELNFDLSPGVPGLWKSRDGHNKLMEARLFIEGDTSKEDWYERFIVPLLNVKPPEVVVGALKTVQEVIDLEGVEVLIGGEGWILLENLKLYAYYSPPGPWNSLWGYFLEVGWWLIREFRESPSERDINFCLERKGWIDIRGGMELVYKDGRKALVTNLEGLLPYTINVIFFPDFPWPNRYFLDEIMSDCMRWVPKAEPWNWTLWVAVYVGKGGSGEIVWVEHDLNFAGVQVQNRKPEGAELGNPSLYENDWEVDSVVEGGWIWKFGFVDSSYRLIVTSSGDAYAFMGTDVDGMVRVVSVLENTVDANSICPLDVYNWDWWKREFVERRVYKFPGYSHGGDWLAVEARDYVSETVEELLLKLPGHTVVSQSGGELVTKKSGSRFDDSFRYTCTFYWRLEEKWKLKHIFLGPFS